jgi:hypothetical protein
MKALSYRRSLVRLALLGGASMIAGLSPAQAAKVLYATGKVNGAQAAQGKPIAGPVTTTGGITQIQMDNGATISFVGDADFTLDGDAQITIRSGQFTATGGAGGSLTIVGGDNVRLQLSGTGESASLGIGADGKVTGRPLSGTVAVTANGQTRSFAAGAAFAASAGRAPAAAITAGVQPVSGALIDQPGSVAQVLHNAALITANGGVAGLPIQQNPAIATIPAGSVADLLAYVAMLPGGSGTPSLSGVPVDLLQAQIAFLRAGGKGGDFSSDFVARLLAQYIAFLSSAQVGQPFPGGSDALLQTYLQYLRSAGLPGDLDAAVRASLTAYLAYLDGGGTFGTLPAVDGPGNEPGEPGAEQPGTKEPGTDQPGTDQPGIGEPGTGGPGTDQPGTEEPGTDGPGTGEPGTGTPPPPNTGAGPIATAPVVRTFLRSSGGRNLSGAPTSLVVNSDGSLESAAFNGNNPETRGTARNADVYANGTVAIGRWTDGKLTAYTSGFKDLVLTANQGVAYALALPAATLPTGGRADYVLAGATQPVFADGSTAPGSVTDAALSVQFGTRAGIGLEGHLTMPEAGGAATYGFRTAGGVANPGGNPSTLENDGSFSLYLYVDGTGAACVGATTCSGFANGALGGLAFDGAALTYAINNRITGALAFGLGSSNGLMNMVPAGTPSGSSSGSGLTDGAQMMMWQGIGAANSNLGANLDYGNSYRVLFDADGSVRDIARITLQASDLTIIATSPLLTRASAVVSEAKAGPGWVIGRWNGGAITTAAGVDALYLPTQGVHVLAMAPASGVLPEGAATYTLTAATRPTFTDGRDTSAASFDATLGVSFGAKNRIGFEGQVAVTDASGAQSYLFSTPGGSAAPSLISFGDIFLSTSGALAVTGNGSACPAGNSSCTLTYGMRSGGEAGKLVGFVYQIQGSVPGQSAPPGITGSALFTQGAVTPRADAAGTELTGQNLIYAGSNVGMDYRGGYTVRVTDEGIINRFAQPITGGEVQYRAGNAVFEHGKAVSAQDYVAWTRWAGGATDGTFYGPAAQGNARSADQGFHMVVGTPASALPTSGTAQYALAGATAPTIGDGSIAPGSLGGTMGVDFAAAKVGLDLNVGIGGFDYAVKTAGGSLDPANGGFALQSQAAFYGQMAIGAGGPACTGATCTAFINGQLYGVGGKLAGLAYRIQGGASGIDPKDVTGVAAFSGN